VNCVLVTLHSFLNSKGPFQNFRVRTRKAPGGLNVSSYVVLNARISSQERVQTQLITKTMIVAAVCSSDDEKITRSLSCCVRASSSISFPGYRDYEQRLALRTWNILHGCW